MKLLNLLVLLVLSLNGVQAQFGPTSLVGEDKNIYALIMGISTYDNPELKLNYADDDAEYFYDFLTSKSGGSVPDTNIQFLLNEEATIANFYVAFRRIDSLISEGDLVYIYFSGHGGYSGNNYKNGFLYAHDTPKRSFMENAIRVLELNDMVNDWSIVKKVNAYVILDACNSGALRENDRGQNLGAVDKDSLKEKQVRISSSGIDQESEESSRWGGGRGIFSYHLIRGLQGLADRPRRGEDEGDGVIVLSELETYIKENVKYDLEDLGLVQTPEFSGSDDALLAFVDEGTLDSIKNLPTLLEAEGVLIASSRGTQLSPPKAFIKDQLGGIIDKFEFQTFETQSKEDIVQVIFNQFKNAYNPTKTNEINWKENLLTNDVLLYEFQQDLAAHLHNEVQVVLNKYLDGDASEIKRRQYYNSDQNKYNEYVDILSTAQKLIDPNNRLYDLIRFKRLYFSGIIKRFKIFNVKNYMPLIDSAIVDHKKALEISQNAAYVYNDLGVSYNLKKNLPLSKQYYEKALELEPDWGVAQSNLSNYYYKVGDYEKALEYAEKALKNNPDLFLGHINYSKSKMKFNDFLSVIDNLHKARKLDFEHYRTFELLGQAYTELADYKSANFFYEEAQKRQTKFMDFLSSPGPDRPRLDPDAAAYTPTPYRSDTILPIQEENLISDFTDGLQALKETNYTLAKEKFMLVVAESKEDPLVYRYLGEVLWKDGKWLEAEVAFDLARQYFISKDSFDIYYDKMLELLDQEETIQSQLYNSSYYKAIDLDYFLGDIYKKRGMLSMAEEVYRKMLLDTPNNYKANHLYWNVLKSQDKLLEAEFALDNYFSINKNIGRRELIQFYDEMLALGIDSSNYFYKKAILLYPLGMVKESQSEPVRDIPRVAFNVEGLVKVSRIDYISCLREQLTMAPTIIDAKKRAILSLENASKDADTLRLAQINRMLGDLYFGKKYKQSKYYNKAFELDSSNVAYTVKAVEYSEGTYQFLKAFGYLSHIKETKSLRLPTLLKYADYLSMNGDYTACQKLLEKWPEYLVGRNQKIEEIQARNFALQGFTSIARKAYLDLIEDYPNDQADYHYALARLEAGQGNETKSYDYIVQAIEKGFDYFWLILNDPSIKSIWTDENWQALPLEEPRLGSIYHTF